MIPIYTQLNHLPSEARGRVVAIGNFDGLHRGHRHLAAQLVDLGNWLSASTMAVTFDPPPITVLQPDIPRLMPITSLARRASLFEKLGVAAMLVLPTSKALLELTAEQFFQEVMQESLQIRGIVEGPNFFFGRGRGGDVLKLGQLCQAAAIDCRIVSPQQDPQGLISSSRIRTLLADGDLATANSWLVDPFELSGIVAEGAQRGRQLGFPTANLDQIDSLIPADGVYAGLARLASGTSVQAAVNIGPNPTFGEMAKKVEIHLLDWQGDLYGQQLNCELVARIRGVRKFSAVGELKDQIHQDLLQVKNRAAQ
jgi:riboflavin kinase/FMN adenylyltransferase